MTIDKESLRPAFERAFPPPSTVSWCGRGREYVGRPSVIGEPELARYQGAFEGWCAAFESLGEPAAYTVRYPDGEPLLGPQTFKSLERTDEFIKGVAALARMGRGRLLPVPLYRLPEVKP